MTQTNHRTVPTTTQQNSAPAHQIKRLQKHHTSRVSGDVLSGQVWWKHLFHWFVYLVIVIVAEGISAIWPLFISGQGTSISVFLFLFVIRAAWCVLGTIVALIALIPLVSAIAPGELLPRAINASGLVCVTFAVQALVLTVVPPSLFLNDSSPILSALGFVVGATSREMHFPWAWLEFALPDIPLIIAAALTLVAANFTATQMRPKLIMIGFGCWLFIELFVRPLMLTVH